jgi:hypothetical protein
MDVYVVPADEFASHRFASCTRIDQCPGILSYPRQRLRGSVAEITVLDGPLALVTVCNGRVVYDLIHPYPGGPNEYLITCS